MLAWVGHIAGFVQEYTAQSELWAVVVCSFGTDQGLEIDLLSACLEIIVFGVLLVGHTTQAPIVG